MARDDPGGITTYFDQSSEARSHCRNVVDNREQAPLFETFVKVCGVGGEHYRSTFRSDTDELKPPRMPADFEQLDSCVTRLSPA